MDDMEQKLNSILGNPEMMAQIMSMAQNLGVNPEPEPVSAPNPAINFGGFDPGMIQKIAHIAQQSGVDSNQQNLLRALRPYLSDQRIEKLEKAMRAARLAGVVTTVLGNSGSLFFAGR